MQSSKRFSGIFFGNSPCIKLVTISHWPYIQSGYTQKYHEQLNGEYYPVDKLISELTPDDMTLLPRGGFYFRFVTRPAQPGKHTLFVRLTADDGKVFEASCDVDFQ